MKEKMKEKMKIIVIRKMAVEMKERVTRTRRKNSLKNQMKKIRKRL